MNQNPDVSQQSEYTRADVICVELFGMPRVIAGTAQVKACGANLHTVLQSIVERSPALRAPLMDPDGSWLNNGYVFVVNGTFTSDPSRAVAPSDELFLVSRASGG